MKYVIDIDGTILGSNLTKKGKYKVISYNYELIEKINALYFSGNEIIIYTGRHWNHLKDTIKQLEKGGAKYHSLVMGKPGR